MRRGYDYGNVNDNHKEYMGERKVLIVAPSLDTATNVSGVSAVTNFIIGHNKECEYEHFLQGRSDGENGALKRVALSGQCFEGKKIIQGGLYVYDMADDSFRESYSTLFANPEDIADETIFAVNHETDLMERVY